MNVKDEIECEKCYQYLLGLEIDCPEVCDVEEARKKMKKLMIKTHPDRHLSEKEKYTELFQKLVRCNDMLIKDRCKDPFAGASGFEIFDRKFDDAGSEVSQKRYELFEQILFPSDPGYYPVKAHALFDTDRTMDFFIVIGKNDAFVEVCDKTGALFSKKFNYARMDKSVKFSIQVAIADGVNVVAPDEKYGIDLWDYFDVKYPGGFVYITHKIPFGGDPFFPASEASEIKHSCKTQRKEPDKGRGEAPVKRITVAQKRADCRAQGLVYDTATGKCRASKSAGAKTRTSPRRRQEKGPTVAQKRADCRAQGLVYDTATGKCRASKSTGGPARKSPRRRSPRRKNVCPSGYARSPTGRCIKIGGAAYKKYFG